MHELFYCSFAVREMSETDILDLIETSRKKNAEIGITGILIYWIKTRQFMQILEGDKDAIFKLLEKIKMDKRHTGVSLVYDGEIPERTFANWSMAFHNFESIDKTQLKGFSTFLKKGFTDELIKKDRSTATNLFQIFKEVLP